LCDNLEENDILINTMNLEIMDEDDEMIDVPQKNILNVRGRAQTQGDQFGRNVWGNRNNRRNRNNTKNTWKNRNDMRRRSHTNNRGYQGREYQREPYTKTRCNGCRVFGHVTKMCKFLLHTLVTMDFKTSIMKYKNE